MKCFRSEFMLLHNKVVEKLVFNSTDHRNILLCTGNTTARVSGLELCGQLVFHNAPLNVVFCNVPSEVTLALHKRDTHSGYKLLAKNIKLSLVCMYTCVLVSLCMCVCVCVYVISSST